MLSATNNEPSTKKVFKIRRPKPTSLKREPMDKSSPVEREPMTVPRNTKKIVFRKVSSKNGKPKFEIVVAPIDGSTQEATKEIYSLPTKTVVETLPLSRSEQKKVNRDLYTALKRNKGANIAELIEKGGSISYLNFEGIVLAAEKGHLDVFKVLFEEIDYKTIIDSGLLADLYETAQDGFEESNDAKFKKLHDYLTSYIGKVPEKIENQNLRGMDDGDESFGFD